MSFAISPVNNQSSTWSMYHAPANTAAARGVPQNVTAAEAPKVSTAAVPETSQAAQAVSTARESTAGTTVSSAEEYAASMSSTSAATAMSVSTNTSLPDLYKFDNQYLYSAAGKTWARIDANSDGAWDRDELTAYAADYYKATGVQLDVDDLMDRYADSNGLIGYADQNRMYEDDALGISHVQDELLRADMGLSGSGSVKVNDKALQDFADKYTYGTGRTRRAIVDSNEDGVWTMDELKDYFKAYEKATGIKMDAEALFNKYDRDGNGVLTYKEINEMHQDDALGLSKLGELLDAQKSGGTSGTDNGTDGSSSSGGSDKLYNTLMDMWGSKFSSKELRALSNAFNNAMEKSAMLDAFMASTMGYYNNWGKSAYGGGMFTNWMASSLSMLDQYV